MKLYLRNQAATDFCKKFTAYMESHRFCDALLSSLPEKKLHILKKLMQMCRNNILKGAPHPRSTTLDQLT
ncbi:hypothetical protein N665_0055s0038 [Sinapis alba]|nr:hypothetical protein N665_0055s0038 [Sinapis alba]